MRLTEATLGGSSRGRERGGKQERRERREEREESRGERGGRAGWKRLREQPLPLEGGYKTNWYILLILDSLSL